MDDLHHLSLCAGIAGIDLGLSRVLPSIRTVAYVEGEAFAACNLVAKMEAGDLDAAPVYPDVKRFPFDKYRGLVDLVSGGFPCQPFAHCGKRKGVDDSRHLWPAIRDGVETLQPDAVFLENVEGITTSPSPRFHCVLHHVLTDLEQLGFRAACGCFTSREVGASHRRRRWFVLGLADRDRGGQPQLRPTHHDNGSDARRHNSGGCSEDVADTNVTGLEGRGRPVFECTDEWVAGPGCTQRSYEQPRTIESSVGGTAHGVPFRVDRLRALGNACVPAQVGNAYAELWEVLNDESKI